MNLILFGTDDCLQHSDACLKERIAALSESRQVTFIGEEYTPNSVAHQVADSKGIRWIPIDMCEKERSDAGIGDLSERRLRYRVNKGIPEETPIYAPKEDGIREYFWLARIEKEQRE